MKKILCISLLSLGVLNCKNAKEPKAEGHQHPAPKEVAGTANKVLSPHTSVMAMIGDAHMHIDYSSPGVRDRIIFGGLLPFNAVWQAGAHMATWIESDKDLSIAGQVLPAGKYGFFVIPTKSEWTLIFNSNWNQHGKDDYKESEDVLRFQVTPKTLDTTKEHLEYSIIKKNDSEGEISLAWEKIAVSFPFKVSN
ncbi:Protein of unknown function [Arenibacter nanhaiticus]|uniref:DUF2911 domain-containing protein n=1 Tax=Arenibacter nanhaiticus TaxID=558155 RepID=A0A1M6CSR3_9FLAO|nr:DUF2911 domain-containing protein [Arenibacter nanhaiticus]SHI63768.1 Protein of unknown function [Arenibacter nanhaiticus]